MSKYLPKEFEKKWQHQWKKEQINKFAIRNSQSKNNKFYALVELPYTSGDLHIGHWFTFTTPDVLARYKRMNGYDVFFPIGYDAFGLPAENAAIKHKVHPKDWTLKNVENMTKQFQTMGTMINNWDDVVITCLPEFYRWNQWIFLKMWERGLAYRGKALSNWCEFDQTVLANENVENGKCWRCGNQIVQKEVEQWFLKITDYADRLVWPEKPSVDWPISVRVGQNNWIGKKEGVLIEFPISIFQFPNKSQISNSKIPKINVFTTAQDTIYGVTFMVLAPENELVKKITTPEYKKEVEKYIEKTKRETEEERKIQEKHKTGVFTGAYCINPFNNEKVPIWIADYVLMSYGTGAVMGVPGHDARDHDLAIKFKLPIKYVIRPKNKEKTTVETDGYWNYDEIKTKFSKDSELFDSGEFSGLSHKVGKEKITEYIELKGWGKRTTTYHLRDWSISRQRYWGTPVPMIHCPKDGIVPVPEKDLPVELPYEVDFTPKGKPPLATNEKWLNVKCPQCGENAQRDPETLDTFFDSAWYWFRYISPHYDKGPFPIGAARKLTPVDVYFGGAEHTLGHTMYARFFTKFFHDLGLVDYEEFALKRVQHGVVLGPDGYRMSKSRGNVVNPDDQVREYGADTVRMYLCFMMPYDATAPWSDKTIAGVHRFLNRVWKIYQLYKNSSTKIFSRDQLASPDLIGGPLASRSSSESEGSLRSSFAQTTDSQKNFVSLNSENKSLVVKLQKTIKKVSKDIERNKMNTAIAAMMEFLNDWESSLNVKPETLNVANAKKFLQILSPFAPFITEEIWRNVLNENVSIHLSRWPKVEGEIAEEEVTIPVQVNGKVRSVISISVDRLSEKTAVEKALKDKKIKKYIQGKKYKAIYVPGKILNFVLF